MNGKYKLMVILSVFALAFAGIAVMDDSEESDAATGKTWTVGGSANAWLMYGDAYAITPGEIPGVTIEVYQMSGGSNMLRSLGSPTTPGSWNLFALNSQQQIVDSMSITVNATSLTVSTSTGGHGTATGGGTYNVGSTFTLTATPNSGYSFDKWVIGSTSVSNNPYSNTVTQAMANAYPNGMTAQATFTSTTTYSHVLYYWPNGGSGAPPTDTYDTTTNVSHTFTISSTVPTRSGYTFLGWSENSSATTATFQPGDSITVNADSARSLYAVWRQNVTYYDVTVYPGNYSYFYWYFGQDASQYSSVHTYSVPAGTTLDIEWMGNPQSSGGSNPSWVTTYTQCDIMATSSGYPGTGSDSYVINSNRSFYPATAMTSSTEYTHYYTITYDANGGSGAPSNTNATTVNNSPAAVSKNITLSSVTPTRAHYGFSGWSEDPSATTATYQYGETYSFPRGTTDLYAVWTPYYDISIIHGTGGTVTGDTSFMVLSGTQISSSGTTITIGSYSATAVPNTDYSFAGWSTSSGTVSSDLTIKASFSWDPVTQNVTITAGTGGSVDVQSLSVHYNKAWSTSDNVLTIGSDTITATPDPGYRFNGWTPSGSGNVTQDMTFTASFVQDYCTVTVTHGLGGTVTGDTNFSVLSGTQVSASGTTLHVGTYTAYASANTDYTFAGWSMTSGQITQNTTIKASFDWDPVMQNVTITAGTGGSVDVQSLSVRYNKAWSTSDNVLTIGTDTITATPNAGYRFNGWTPSGSGNVTQDMTFTASFVEDYYTVTITHGLGGTVTGDTSFSVLNGTQISASGTTITIGSYSATAVPNTDYSFTGWSRTSGQITQNTTILASFDWDPAARNITITAGTGGSVDVQTLSVSYNTSWSTLYRELTIGSTTITATPDPGYSFASWTPSGSGNITQDMTFTASFTVNGYPVSFQRSPNDGGTISPGYLTTVDYGTTYTVDNVNGTIVLGSTTYTANVNSGYSFAGWTDSGSAAVSGTITGNKTFVANFSANTYTVTFNANGGTVSPSSKTVTYNDWYGQLPTPTYAGHTFSGWYDQQTGGNQVTSGTTVTTASNHTLWAHWSVDTFTVTIQSENPYIGSVSPTSVPDVPYGTVITVSGNTININGTTVTATATDPDWYFNEWQNVSGPIQANRTVIADFSTGGVDHGTRENPLNGIDYSVLTLWYQEDKTYYVLAGTLVDIDKYILLNTTFSVTNVTSGAGLSVVSGELYGNISENATVTIQSQSQQQTSTQTINLVCVYPPLTVNVTSGGHGTVTGSGVYEVGETVTITGTPDQDYAFIRWTMQGGSTSANPWVFVVDRMVSGQTYNITGEFAKSVTDVTVTVSGEHGQVKVNDGVPSLQVTFRAYITGVLTQQGITVSGNTASFPYSTTQNVIAIPEAGYRAVWSVSNGDPVTDGMTVTLSFERIPYTITASSSSVSGGEVQIEDFNQSTSDGPGSSVSITAYYGDTVQLTATPLPGFYLDKWMKNGQFYGNSLVFTITVTSDESFQAVFEATVITVTFDATGGTVSPSSKTVYYGQTYGQLPTPTMYGFQFLGWYTDAAVGDRITENSTVTIDHSHYLYAHWMEQMPDVFWWNDYANGSMDIAFDFTGLADSRLHVMYIPLYSYNSSTETDLENDPHGLNQFDQTGYTLRISCGYNTDLTLAIYQNGILQGEIYTYKIGMWNQYALEINVQTGKIMFKGIHALMDRQTTPFTFMNYKVVMSVTAIDFSDRITGLAFERVYHADTGTGAHPSFQVSSTMTYLNTYGFVLVDPSINIYEQFPNYDNLRLNFYSFVYYGDSITVNGHTIALSDFGLLDLWYVPKNTPIYNDQQQIIGYTTENVISDPSDPRAIEQKIELQNIFVTWNNLHSETESERTCYLTFVDGKLDIAMGTFDIGDLEVSFSGVWYFTTMLYEPYIGKEMSYEMDWNSWFNMDANAFILVYIALSVVFFVIANRIYQPGFLDYIVVGGAGLISYILLGGF